MSGSFFWRQDGLLKNSSGLTAPEWIDRFREMPEEQYFNYPTSSVERGMAATHLNEALELVKPDDEEELREKFQRMIEASPYTNWSGD